MARTIGIAGAGLLGRLLAWRLARAGHRVSVFDPAPGPGPRFGEHGPAQHAAGFSAAGLLSPTAERDTASPRIAALGWRSIGLWRETVQALQAQPRFAQRGSWLLAHRDDLGAARRVLARVAVGTGPQPQALTAPQIATLEPALQGIAHAWLLPGEAQIDTVATMLALQAEAPGVQWHWGRKVESLQPGRLRLAGGEVQASELVIDVRGAGAREAAPRRGEGDEITPHIRGEGDGITPHVRGEGDEITPHIRGVKGETVWLRLPGHGLQRPVRLLHPRHRVYLVPRAPDTLVLGASEIESEDRGEVSLRSAVELMAAAHSVMPALAEARVLRLDSNLRPALPDHEPRIEAAPGLLRINGLFRHGWLLAPALVEDALTACGVAAGQVAA